MMDSDNSTQACTLLDLIQKGHAKLKVKQPDNFYLTDHTFPPESYIIIYFNDEESLIAANYELLNQVCNISPKLRKQLLNMPVCLVTFNAEVYHRFQLQVCRLSSIKLLPFHSLAIVCLTTSHKLRLARKFEEAFRDITSTAYVRKRSHYYYLARPIVVYMSQECFKSASPSELVCLPVNKRKTQYIAGYAKSVEESFTNSREQKETDLVCCVNGCLGSIVTNTESTVIQYHSEHHQKDNARSELVVQHKHVHVAGMKESGVQKEYLSVKNSSTRHHANKRNLTMYKKKSVSRPVTKKGVANVKTKVKVCEETHSGSSSLRISNQWNAYSVVQEHARQHPLRALCLSTRSVPFNQISLNSQSLRHQHSSSQQSSNSDISVRHRIRLEHNRAVLPASTTRDVDRDCTEIRLTHLPFDNLEITQLLHALEYSRIIQQIESIPSNHIRPDSVIPLYFVKGVAYFKMSKYKEAHKQFTKSESAARKANRDGDVMLCNAYLGDIKYTTQSYTEAVQYYKAAIAHYTTGCVAIIFKLTPPTLSAIHAKLASAYRSVSMMVQAIQHYKTAIEVAKADRDRLSSHTSLGNLYQSMGDNSNALTEYKESIALAEKLSDHVSLGWAHGNIGNAYLGLNKKDEAVHHLHKSLDLAVEYEQTPQAIGRTYNNLGTAYQSMNDLDKAEEYYDLALSQAVYGNDTAGQARVYGNIGNVHMLRKNYERAIPHYSEVLRLSKDPSTISTAQHNRGCAYYEWATSLLPKSKKHRTTGEQVSASEYHCTFHSPDCDVDKCLSRLSLRAKELFGRGCEDLREVVKYHEERLQHIKGSSNGLTLSVSLFEANSRTFHRLQDCLVNLHKFEEALVVAEQSRARTLGELLLKRKREQLTKSLNSPLNFDEIVSILQPLENPIIYFSYTGARLICWLFFPSQNGISMQAFDIPLADDQFNGKSFDYLLRYSLTENLVERSFEMYQAIKYNAQTSEEVQALYRLIGKPTLEILQKYTIGSKSQQVTTICDSYTSLLPLTCLFDDTCNLFLGDRYFFNQIPSFLTMGVVSQFSSVEVDIGGESRDFCVIGDPNIPPFLLNGELWSLGRLPHARKEAEWVSHALQTAPVLGDQATKSALLIRLMSAKVVHIATHGSASAGFLAFSSFAVHANERSSKCNQVHGSNVLLYPEEVEKLYFSPALVVLSSCDSGRGTVKADGIQGMARAFILAGAQSVLTTLWKIPDESASVFMQFFYQYLLDEMSSSFALQKAILSVRCFAKYSQYIHWSGYQLTGRDIRFLSTSSHSSMILKDRLGEPSIFPRLPNIKKLENALVKSPCPPTDVQIVTGSPGIKPAEVVIDFVSSFHKTFSGGIFWINCLLPEMLDSSIERIQKITNTDIDQLPLSEVQQALFILDNMSQLPVSEALLRILRNHNIHIIVISEAFDLPSKFIKEIDRKLVRGCVVHQIEPLTMIHSTQRMVHTLLRKLDVTPTNLDQEMFEKLAEFTVGSPVIIDIASEVMLTCYEQLQRDAVLHLNEMLSLEDKHVSKAHSPGLESMYRTDSMYDFWESIMKLVQECNLSPEERLLLNSLSVFKCYPVPFSLVTEMSSLITRSRQMIHLTRTLYLTLYKYKLVRQYPHPVVLNRFVLNNKPSQPPEYLYVPQQVAQSLWNDMGNQDQVFALSLAYHAISKLHDQQCNQDISGICSLLHEVFEDKYTLVGQRVYQDMYRLFLSCKYNITI